MIDIGSVVNGKYRLVRLVGDGGMGSVYEATHEALGTRVAIKVLHPELARRPGLVERFLQEARVAAQIRSPHVVQVTDIDRTPDGQAYIVMELLEGEPLSGVLDRQRTLPVPTACEYTRQILEALEAAHALGVIHRDLKPENVFLTFAAGKPVLKLIDFGIAKARAAPDQRKLTVAGVVMGTAEYMAPEQARSADKVDARADLYAAGVLLYEMIAGTRPVTGDDARVIALRVERGEIVPLVQVVPDVPRELAGLVHRAMASVPDLRFATATEMRLALERVMAGGARATGVTPASAVGSVLGPVSAAPLTPPRAVPSQPEMTATGTVKNMSAQQALAMAGLASPRPPSGAPRTDVGREPLLMGGAPRAAPAGTALAAPLGAGLAGLAHTGPGVPAHSASAVPAAPAAGRPRRGRGPIVALLILAIALGAGLVALLVAGGGWSSPTPTPPLPGLTEPEPSAPPSGSSAPGTPPSTATVPVPDLPPSPPRPPRPSPGPGPVTPPHPTPTSHGDAGAPPPPYLNPSSLPLPGVLPLPNGFPTALPAIPGWPQPAPAPTPRGSAI